MTDYVLIGDGAWARELVDWFADAFESRGDVVVGFLQDDDWRGEDRKLAVPHLGPVAPASLPPGAKAIMAVAKPRLKAVFGERFPDRSVFATLVHPTALVSPRRGPGPVLRRVGSCPGRRLRHRERLFLGRA